MRDLPIGRLAVRTEGDYWNAYYAQPDTMDGAVPLGSIAIAAVSGNEHRKAAFMQLMQATVGDIIESVTGRRPRWPGDPQVLPETEGGEVGSGAVTVQPPAIAEPPGPKRRLLGRGWDDYAKLLPDDAPPVQLQETRRAFYAGARACLIGFFGSLSQGEDVTADDEALLAGIDAELVEFHHQVQAGLV